MDCRLVEVIAQRPASRWVPKLTEGDRFDLADAFAGDTELAADLFERTAAAVVDAEAERKDLALAWRE